jgi:hypothetical protein
MGDGNYLYRYIQDPVLPQKLAFPPCFISHVQLFIWCPIILMHFVAVLSVVLC